MPISLETIERAMQAAQQGRDWSGLTVDRLDMRWEVVGDDKRRGLVETIDDVTGNRVTWYRSEFLSRKLTIIEDDIDDVTPE